MRIRSRIIPHRKFATIAKKILGLAKKYGANQEISLLHRNSAINSFCMSGLLCEQRHVSYFCNFAMCFATNLCILSDGSSTLPIGVSWLRESIIRAMNLLMSAQVKYGFSNSAGGR